MKKQILIFVALVVPILASADSVEIDGISYNLIDKNNNHVAEVTSNPNYYKGSVVIPDKVTNDGIEYSVTSIGNGAFQFCSGLTSVHISDLSAWCKIIFGNPNYQSNPLSNAHHLYINNQEVTNLVIPEDVTTIGEGAFDGVDILTVISLIENPFAIYGKSSNYRTFSQNTFMNATLYVPKGTIDKYKATDGWKDFVFIEEGEPSGITNIGCEGGKELIRYTLDGKIAKSSHKGINIIQMDNGTTKKVVVK